MPYQVKDWSLHFENDRSKERDRCSFVCVPNKQHGMGFSYVMAEKDGAMVYGIWQLIIGACSQQKRPRNGWLTSDGDKAGSPWGVEDLAMKFRRPVSEIRRAIDVLSSPKVAWLSNVQVIDSKELPQTPYAVTTESLPTPLEGKERREGKEGKATCSLDELKAYCKEHGLPESDGETLFYKWEGNGWVNGKQKIVNWKATVQSWKRNGYLPSQKQTAQPQPRPEPAKMIGGRPEWAC